MATLRYDRLPAGLRGGMERYIENGIPPGHFLTAVLSNDLRRACERADDCQPAPALRDRRLALQRSAGAVLGIAGKGRRLAYGTPARFRRRCGGRVMPALDWPADLAQRETEIAGDDTLEARAIDFENWAAENGIERGAYSEPGLHRSSEHVSGAARRANLRNLAGKIENLTQRQTAARAEYDRLVAAGELRPLTDRERLERTAAGHDDNNATLAARRLLGRVGARDAAPFAIGARVLGGRDLSAHTVAACQRHPRGHWLVYWTDQSGISGIGPAEHFRLAPEGYVDPPAVPCPDYSDLGPSAMYGPAGQARREEPEFQARMAAWEKAMRAWRARWWKA